ncbi:MAG: hypothetical protein ACE5HX_02245 [bacterium]
MSNINKLLNEARAGSKIAENKIFEKLHERFLHLAQYILCNREAAKIVATKALKVVREKYKEIPPEEKFLIWAQTVLDNEIENYFQERLEKIKANSKTAETELFKILQKRFLFLVKNKINRDNVDLDPEDAEDIVQYALKTVYEKCKTSKPKGKFIQSAQQISSNKYLECRKKILRNKKRMERLTKEEYEPVYTQKIADFIKKKSSEKPMAQELTPLQKSNSLDRKPFEDDPFDWQPVLLTECSDLKKHLLSLVKKMSERCKKVFEVLFSGGDVESIHKKFPDLTRQQIYVVISKCRSQLKAKAMEKGILE